MITRENYEIYFIDYFDGNLSVELTAKLLLFLEQNLDLKQEFESFQNLNISEIFDENSEPNPVDFSGLKKRIIIDSENEDDYFIGYIENDLSEEEKKTLLLYISDNKANKIKFESFRNIKLPIPFIPFPNKNKLKKSKGKVIYFYASLFAAACVLAFVLIPSFNNNSPNDIEITPVIVEQIPKENIPNKNTPLENEIKEIQNFIEIKNEQKKRENRLISKTSVPIKTKLNLPIRYREKNVLIEKYASKDFLILKNQDRIKDYTPIKVLKLPTIEENLAPINRQIKSYTLLGFAKTKTNSFLKNKIGFDMNSPKDFLKMATLKTQKMAEDKSEFKKSEDEKYIYKSFKIGKLITISWKRKK